MSTGRSGVVAAGASIWLWLSFVVILADQWTKQLIIGSLEEFERIPLLPVLEFMRLHNTGAAFSFLDGAGGWTRWFFILLGISVSIFIVLWLRRMPRRGQGILAAGLAFVVGGALGNVIDRIRFGAVVDFLDFYVGDYHWPAFNVADSAITVGVTLLILDSLKSGHKNP